MSLKDTKDIVPEDDCDAGAEEAARRRDELEAGKAGLISADEFWAAVTQERAA